MKWLSFNCRWLASPTKRLALKRLLEVEKVDAILLQETLGDFEHIFPTLAGLSMPLMSVVDLGALILALTPGYKAP